MSDSKDQHEPSMEEILASIRRIISEDAEPGAEPEAAAAAPPSAAEAEPVVTPPPPGAAAPAAAPRPAAGAVPAPAADVEDDDVLLLTEEVEEELPPRPPSPPEPPPIYSVDPEPEAEPIHMVELEDELVSEPEPEPESEPFPPFRAEEEPEPPPPPPRRSAPPPEPEPIFAAPIDDRLISDHAAAASLAALSELVTRSHREPEIESMSMGQSNQTLEDLTRELLRPILKSWLDENLPQIVERIVREEIGRLALDAQRR